MPALGSCCRQDTRGDLNSQGISIHVRILILVMVHDGLQQRSSAVDASSGIGGFVEATSATISEVLVLLVNDSQSPLSARFTLRCHSVSPDSHLGILRRCSQERQVDSRSEPAFFKASHSVRPREQICQTVFSQLLRCFPESPRFQSSALHNLLVNHWRLLSLPPALCILRC